MRNNVRASTIFGSLRCWCASKIVNTMFLGVCQQKSCDWQMFSAFFPHLFRPLCSCRNLLLFACIQIHSICVRQMDHCNKKTMMVEWKFAWLHRRFFFVIGRHRLWSPVDARTQETNGMGLMNFLVFLFSYFHSSYASRTFFSFHFSMLSHIFLYFSTVGLPELKSLFCVAPACRRLWW